MKLYTLLICIVFTCLYAQAQKSMVDLKPGTSLTYSIETQGQQFPMTLKVVQVQQDLISFEFEFQGDMKGTFINGKENLEKGEKTNWDQPYAGEERQLPPDQTIAMLSRTFFRNLKKNGKASYDGMEFQIGTPPVGTELVDGKPLDMIFAATADGVRVWLINNEQFPVICKLEGHPSGINMALTELK